MAARRAASDKEGRTARDSTSINPEMHGPIDPPDAATCRRPEGA